jgi:hypothetical protein
VSLIARALLATRGVFSLVLAVMLWAGLNGRPWVVFFGTLICLLLLVLDDFLERRGGLG